MGSMSMSRPNILDGKKTAKEIRQLRRRDGEQMAYVVEACPNCRWHHLLRVIPV